MKVAGNDMKVLVIGGGLAGFSAAAHLDPRFEVELLEQEDSVGGLLRTDRHEGYLFDHGLHLFFHQDDVFLKLFDAALASIGTTRRTARIGQRSFGGNIDYPYAMHLFGLPATVVTRCVAEFADRRLAVARGEGGRDVRTYEDYCRTHYGDGFTEHFMIPYAEKIWTVHPRELDIDWVGTRIVLPELRDVIEGALSPRTLVANYIRAFRYPARGGSQAFIDGVAAGTYPRVVVADGMPRRFHRHEAKAGDRRQGARPPLRRADFHGAVAGLRGIA